MNPFIHYQLRTTDVPGARAFYAAILGDAERDIVPLPEAAAARGAPAHWLGQIAVDDIEQAAAAFTARGATRLGPAPGPANPGDLAILRDPGGAIVALTTRSEPQPDDIVWHQLHTTDLDRATAIYCELFAWHPTERVDIQGFGPHQHFAWQPDGPTIGSIAATALRPGIHPHWLFHFKVASLDSALATIRATGGRAMDPVALPDGRMAACEDPQGAAFAVREMR